MQELTPYQCWQFIHYGTVLPEGQGTGQDADPMEWVELQHELELKEKEDE